MISEPDQNTIEKALNDLCAHPIFVNSLVYKQLLQYLVKKAIEKEDIKEYTIGADLFGKNYLNDKNDGAVRTHMYKLRKKMAAYYADRNVQNEIIFEIKKGQYNLDFISKKEYDRHKRSLEFQIPLKWVKGIGLVLLLTFGAIWGISYYLGRPPALWEDFLKNGDKTLVVISDQYMLMHTNIQGEKHPTMYSKINSDEDLFAFKKEHPDRKLEMTDFTLVSKMAPYGIKNLDEWFFGWDSDFKLGLESNLTLNNIKENNIVFIGQFKTMNLSKSFFLRDSKVFSTYGDGFKVNVKGKKKVYTTQFAPNKKVEYALVSFTSLSPDKRALFFVSNNDIGVMATLRLFTDPTWLKTLEEKLPQKNSRFNALFEVSGMQRTQMSSELIELEILGD
ncbi:hypothetical protein SAMN05421766_102166 [Zobellia uliginosa]|uniref:Helix-turn-helix domain-containing protein n=1 Tax=Zobellia uliginosa TaxID=143224 RepID=A0ABY1KLV8_9FLAO|nr:hypothetical protein [Zobellia uliginosa]SIS47737.1 hypothetical protein SAMN05421766_102166 [Zobellia uliginosa]